MSLANMGLENISINSHAEISEHFPNRKKKSNFIIGEMIMLYHKQGPVSKLLCRKSIYVSFFPNSLPINIRTGKILLCH